MKKQFLILILFVAAIVAGTSSAKAQTLSALLDSCIIPTPLDCDSASALRPAPGESYTYTISSDDYAGSGAELVHWFVIDYNDLTANSDSIINSVGDVTHLSTYIDAGDGTDEFLLTSGSSYNIDFGASTPNTSDSVTLSWQYFDGQANVVLLVAYVEDAVNCTNNMEVYRIIPEPAFTLDIAAYDEDLDIYARDTANPADECASPIESAWYVPAADPASPGQGTLNVDYGENWVYFVVNAANFVDSWMPTFQFNYDGLGGNAILSADWTYYTGETSATGWNSIDVTTGVTTYVVGGGGDETGPTNAQGDGISVGAAGECIVVRVGIDHGQTDENLVTRRLTVSVNGTMYDPAATTAGTEYDNATLDDFGPDQDATPGCDQVDFDDTSVFDITPRPEVQPVDPTPFEQKDPNGNSN